MTAFLRLSAVAALALVVACSSESVSGNPDATDPDATDVAPDTHDEVGPPDDTDGDATATDTDSADADGSGAELDVVTGPVAICPEAREGAVLRVHELEGAYDAGGGSAMTTAVWQVLETPPGHSGEMTTDGLTISFFADVAGDYVFRLTVVNGDGDAASCETTIVATTTDLLRVELSWSPDFDATGGATDGSDLDLHLHRNATGEYRYYGDTMDGDPDDCGWSNCATCEEPYEDDAEREVLCRAFLDGRPEDIGEEVVWPAPVLSWPPEGFESDPRLDLDDVEGAGPENINIRRPSAGTYRIAVHLWDAAETSEPIDAYVRVLCAGEQIYASEAVGLSGNEPGATPAFRSNDLWEVGDVTIAYDDEIPSCEFVELGGTGCHRICPLSDGDPGGCEPEECE